MISTYASCPGAGTTEATVQEDPVFMENPLPPNSGVWPSPVPFLSGLLPQTLPVSSTLEEPHSYQLNTPCGRPYFI